MNKRNQKFARVVWCGYAKAPKRSLRRGTPKPCGFYIIQTQQNDKERNRKNKSRTKDFNRHGRLTCRAQC
ncbi:hypothetical protein, partial [Ornithobacterium rhinotracheale]